MEQVPQEQRDAIRLYWSNYYNYNEALEILHRKLSTIRIKVRNEEEDNDYITSNEEFETYLCKKQDFYTSALKLFKKLQFQIEEIDYKMAHELEQHERLLFSLNLKMEQRDYDEKLYNLVNGLEDDLYVKK